MLPGEVREIHRCRRFVLCRQASAGGTVVRKTLRKWGTTPREASLVRHEYAVLRRLDVPGVVRPLAIEGPEDAPTLVLEDDGPEDLEERLSTGPLPLDVFFDIASELADICARIHARSVVHRAIAPSHVVLGPDGKVTLIHFSDASSLASVAGRIELESASKLAWIAPEQTGRMNRLVDWRSDLYSLGLTFYAMLAGAPPFRSSDPLELTHAHLARMPVPASVVNPRIPPMLSDIVQKLLSKMPERRYQSAEALAADLREARRQWLASRSINPFELGRLDLARELPLPMRLYGRELELAVLANAFARVSSQGTELVLVSGDAGIGKTALVGAARDAITVRGGWFASGKFDQRAANVPYGSVSEALRALARMLLSQPEERREQEFQRLRVAVGPNSRTLIALVPEFREVFGDEPALQSPGPLGAERRFHIALQDFVRAVAATRPLALFLDDLQWTDEASLRILRALATAPESRHVLLLGTFRSRETGPDHALTRTLDEIQTRGGVIRRLELGPLGDEATVAFLADVLRCEPEQARPLARLVLAKTAGNPFFVRQLLRSLQRLGLLVFDEVRGGWTWELHRLERVGITENVAELMTAAIRGMSAQAQQLLQIAACVGKRVDLPSLAELWGRSVDETAARLGEVLREGLLLPEDEQGPEARLSFRFVHDRVQQAVYTLLPASQRKELHLRIGRRLSEPRGADEHEQKLFDAVDQLDLGAELLGEAERVELARLNHRAGNRARSAAAYGPALAYFQAGLGLLPKGAWQSHHELWFLLQRDAAECAFLTGDHALCVALLEEGLRHALSVLEKADLHGVRVMSATTQGDFTAAVQAGREALRMFGLELPQGDLIRAAGSERETIRALLRGRSPAELLDTPNVSTAEDDACAKLLATMQPATYFIDHHLYALMAARSVRFALEHGQSAHASMSYSAYALFLAAADEPAEAEAFNQLALELARKWGDVPREAEALHINAFILSWRRPFSFCASEASRAFVLAKRVGEVYAATYALTMHVLSSFASGMELDRVLAILDDSLSFCRGFGAHVTGLYLLTLRQAIRCLKGLTRGRNRFDDAEFDEQSFLLAATRSNATTVCWYCILRLESSYLFRELATARTWSERALAQLHFLEGNIHVMQWTLYTALTLLSLCDGATGKERAELLTRAATLRHQLLRAEENCAENARHKRLLVDAELARVEGQPLEAARLYDQAIEAASKVGFLQDTALANELCGRHYHALGRLRIAEMYLRAAVQGWVWWGALDKAHALDAAFALGEGHEGLGIAPPGAALDVLSLLKAAETVSSEIVLDRLLGKLMEVCIQAAGAERGVLVFEEESGPFVRAIGRAGEPVSTERTPLESARQIPRELVEHVRRTRKGLVLDDTSQAPAFASDPYLAQGFAKSIMVLPVQRKESLLGTLCFENDLTTRAFTRERLRGLELLSAELAIALENSLLFEKLKVAEHSMRFLANVSETLAESLDYPTTLRSFSSLVVPTLADWCIIDVVGEDGQIRRVAVTHAEPTKADALRKLEHQATPDRIASQPSARALTSGKSILLPQFSSALPQEPVRDAERDRLLRLLGKCSAMAVPLIARGRTLGAITLGIAASKRSYGPSDLAFAEELARRAAMAVDNARLYHEAQEAIRVREEFLGIAAHELKTPITTMKFTLQGFFRRHEQLSGEQIGRVLRTTEKQLERLLRLVNELLDVSRLHAGHLDLQPERVDLSTLVDDVVRLFAERIAQTTTRVDIRAEAPVVGMWDRGRLEHVVANLIDNALKFGSGNPVSITVARRGDTAELTVEDHGIGIPPERLPHVFDRFERAVSDRHYGGFGLGLYIVRSTVEAFGGTVRVDSRPGEGSKFTVELPCADDAVSPHGLRTEHDIGLT